MNALADARRILCRVLEREIARDVSVFGTAQKAVRSFSALRLVPPDDYDPTGTDIQGRFINKDGRGFWIAWVSFAERARRQEWR